MAEEEEVPAGPKAPKVLVVLTSKTAYPDESETGFWLGDVSNAVNMFVSNGWECDYASPEGTASADPASISMGSDFTKGWYTEEQKALITENKTLASIVEGGTATADYDCLYIAGGFGAYYDFPDCAELQTLITGFLDAEKVVAATSAGTVALVNVMAGDVKLVAEKEVTGMSTAELSSAAEAMGKGELSKEWKDVQTEFAEAGAKFQVGLTMQSLVVQSGKLFTGKNPVSSAALAKAVVYFYDPIKAEFEPAREALLKKREALVAAMEQAELNFVAKLGAFKSEGAEEKLEELQTTSQAGSAYYTAQLANVDMQLERNATLRQAALDAKAAAAAAEAEE